MTHIITVIKLVECHVRKPSDKVVPRDIGLEFRGGIWLTVTISPFMCNYEATFICDCNMPSVSTLLVPFAFKELVF